MSQALAAFSAPKGSGKSKLRVMNFSPVVETTQYTQDFLHSTMKEAMLMEWCAVGLFSNHAR